jgi:hypothetical protein
MARDRESRIRARAHEILEREGQPHGAEQRHWEQASTEIELEEAQRDTEAAAEPGVNSDAADASVGAKRKTRPAPSGTKKNARAAGPTKRGRGKPSS